LEEYSTAFEKFRNCVERGGGTILSVRHDPSSGLISYGVGSDVGQPGKENLSSVEGRCYHDEFSWIEEVFQTTDPKVIAQLRQGTIDFFSTQVVPCLKKNGVEVPPPPVVIGSQPYVNAMTSFGDLVKAGKC
jgi:hypothetical protein